MAVLEKIRVKLGILISILIAVALLSFIIDPNTLGSTLQSMSKENNVGSMGGKSISYREYYTALEQNTSLMNALTGGNSNTEESQRQLREMTWNQFYNQKVFFPKIKKAGFSVEDAEMVELLQGENPSPVISQQTMFRGEDGQFSPEAVKTFVAQMDLDESGLPRRYWDYLKEQVYAQQMYNKYYSAVRNSDIMNASQLNRAVNEGNLTKDVDWFMVPINFGVDSTIKITSAEVTKYYNDRKEQYRQWANRDIEYVVFEVEPSAEDIEETKAVFDDLYNQFAVAENLKNFVALNSDRRWDDNFYSKDELASTPAIADFAFGGTGAISPVDSTAEAFTAVRVAERKRMPDQVQFAYSLFPMDKRASADSLLAEVKKNGGSDDLMPTAKMSMKDMAANGMDVFAEAFDMRPGETRLIEIDQYQMLAVLKLVDASELKDKVKLAILRKNINPSDNTYRDYNMKAADLADRSDNDYAKFAAIVKEEGLPVVPMQHVTYDTKRIGDCDNARQVVHWVFDRKTKEGSVSDVITVDNKYYFVAAVTKVRKEGRIPLEEVKDDILTQLINDKKVEKVAEEAKAKISGGESLDALAEKFNTTVNHKEGMSFGALDMSVEPSFAGAVASAPEGEVVGPVKGQIGVYFFQVAKAEDGEFFSETDALNRSAQKGYSVIQQLPEIIKQEAEVKDYRGKFY